MTPLWLYIRSWAILVNRPKIIIKRGKSMKITEEEKRVANNLIESFLEKKNKLPYANIGDKNEYLGWVKNFNLTDSSNDQKISLDLNNNNDLFLLFVLAIVWSRSGPWENSAYFVAYLKINKKDTIQYWINEKNYKKEEKNRKDSAEEISIKLKGMVPRKKISFRRDIFSSVHKLAEKWDDILIALETSERENEFESFMKYVRKIKGLGVNNRKMLIKITLILRELRCQSIYSNISGELCCVPDARVYKAAKELKIKIPTTNNLENLTKSSTKIYRLFGDLYDLPLFAYEDLKKN
jgi:hypothetical protein